MRRSVVLSNTVRPVHNKFHDASFLKPGLMSSLGLLLPHRSSLPPAPTNSVFSKPSRKLGNAAGLLRASLLDSPILWAGRLCIFYALIKLGVAGSKSNPLVSGLESTDDNEPASNSGFSEWWKRLEGTSDNDATGKRKLVNKWHITRKGTLKRSYRVTSKSVGQNLLKSIATLLSDDDHFRDATSHKGCQIRRENAHGESVCCNNVRALFDELPTPHLVIEITAFPAGPLSDNDYIKAEKLERILKASPSI